jgi:ribulose bisphosphate carboxylase small subunit
LFEAVALDHFGPISTHHPNKYHYVLLCKDLFSGFTSLIRAKTTSAVETAELFYEHYLNRFGFIPKILTDRGSAFINSFMETLTQLAQIKHLKTAAFSPRTNGSCEVMNKFLAHGLRTYITQDTTDWTRILPTLEFGNAALVNPSTGLSPFSILFNQKPRLPFDSAVLEQTLKVQDQTFVSTFLPSFEILRDVVKMNHAENKVKMKQYHDQFCAQSPIKKGDRVFKLIENPPSGVNEHVSQKILPRYDGPYLVLARTAHNAKLQHIYTGKELKAWVNVTKLKLVKHCRSTLLDKYNKNRSQATPSDKTLTQSGDPATPVRPPESPSIPENGMDEHTLTHQQTATTTLTPDTDEQNQPDDLHTAPTGADSERTLVCPQSHQLSPFAAEFQPTVIPVNTDTKQITAHDSTNDLPTESSNTPTTTHNHTTIQPDIHLDKSGKLNVEYIQQRRKFRNRLWFRVKLVGCNELRWVLPHQLPHDLLEPYMERMKRMQAIVKKRNRRRMSNPE